MNIRTIIPEPTPDVNTLRKWLRWHIYFFWHWLKREYLNPFHVVRSDTGRPTCWRLYGVRPYFRMCWFDYTRASVFVGKPDWVRVQILRVNIYERNREFSGLPK